jgi:hypothetical protein
MSKDVGSRGIITYSSIGTFKKRKRCPHIHGRESASSPKWISESESVEVIP